MSCLKRLESLKWVAFLLPLLLNSSCGDFSPIASPSIVLNIVPGGGKVSSQSLAASFEAVAVKVSAGGVTLYEGAVPLDTGIVEFEALAEVGINFNVEVYALGPAGVTDASPGNIEYYYADANFNEDGGPYDIAIGADETTTNGFMPYECTGGTCAAYSLGTDTVKLRWGALETNLLTTSGSGVALPCWISYGPDVTVEGFDSSGTTSRGTLTLSNGYLPDCLESSADFATTSDSGGRLSADYNVFVSSKTYLTTDVSDEDSADFFCDYMAKWASLAGEWKAWVSSSTSDASSRLPSGVGPWKLVYDSSTIAANLAGLTSGTIVSPIGYDEFGNVYSGPVHTGTQSNGTHLTSCSDWTDGSSSTNLTSGSSTTSAAAWTMSSSTDICTSAYPIYCFQSSL